MIKKSYLDLRVFGGRHAVPEDIDPDAWARELRTAKEIIKRLKKQSGVLLADDTGLGKTWVAALTALAIAKKGGRVLILVPNKPMVSKWERDLYKVRKFLLGDNSKVKIRPDWQHIVGNNIALSTHHQFFQDHFPNVKPHLLIVDEAHRSKGDDSSFRERLRERSNSFQGFLFLTATPFSISVGELISIINLVAEGEDKKRESAFKAFATFAMEVQKGECKKDINETEECWKTAVSALKPWVIRHTIDGLDKDEKKSFGKRIPWGIEVPPADEEVIEILIHADRLLNLKGSPDGVRGSDPRFHVGWHYLRQLLTDDPTKLPEELKDKNEDLLRHVKNVGVIGEYHLNKIREKLRKVDQHPKVKAVVDAVAKRVVEDKEKVVVFCHHITTMHEVADAMRNLFRISDQYLKSDSEAFRKMWSEVWMNLLKKHLKNKELRVAVQEWVNGSAFRRQVISWLTSKPESEQDWKEALQKNPVRGMNGKNIPSILKAVLEFAQPVSYFEESTKAEIETIPKIFSHKKWGPVTTARSKDLDAQLALFNTPFGPDVLIATDRLSEGIDLHKCCRLLVHYEFDPSPIRIRQREGRIRRIKGWAQRIGKPIEYAYPTFPKTRDELLVQIVKDRLKRFDLLLGGSSSVDINNIDNETGGNPDINLLDKLEKRIGTGATKCLTIPKGK